MSSLAIRQPITDAIISRLESNTYITTNSINVREFRDNSSTFTPPEVIVRVYGEKNSIHDTPLHEAKIDIMCVTHQADDLSGASLEALYQNVYGHLFCGATKPVLQSTLNTASAGITIQTIEFDEEENEDQYDFEETLQMSIVKAKIYVQLDTVSPIILLRSTELESDYELNDPISTWRDASGNGYDATQSTAAKKPLYKTSPFGSAKFDASDDELSFNGVITPLSTATKGAIHLYVTGFNTGHGILTLNTTDNNTGLYVLINSADELDVVFFSNGSVLWQHKTDITPKATFDLKVIHNGTTPKIYKDDVDITNLTTTTDETAWFGDITAWNQSKIGVADLTGLFAFYGSGQISHCAIYNTDATINQMNCEKP